jgi:hypothetical protein
MKAILSSLALLLGACAPASAQFPSEASKSAVVSTAITMLAPHSECGALIQRVKTLQPYLGKSVDSSAGDEKFWREYGQSYEGIWDTWSPCVGAAMQSKDTGAQTAALTLAVVIADFRGDALAWMVKQVSEQREKYRKDVIAYIDETHKYEEAQQKYVGDLERYARQTERQQAQAERQQSLLQTLLLLKALSAPPAPQIVYVQQPRQAPVVNLGVHCTVQPTITGQTFINCY